MLKLAIKSVAASSVATIGLAFVSAGTVGVIGNAAMAQDTFGNLPTVTPQGQAERNRRARTATENRRREDPLPAYVVVDKGGPRGGPDRHVYTTIQEGINAVAKGGVVVVMPGVYNENVELNRSVILQGDRGAGAGVVVRPTNASQPCLKFAPDGFNDHVKVSNITFQAPDTPVEASLGAGMVNASPSAYTACVDVERGVFTMEDSTVQASSRHFGNLVSIRGGTSILSRNRVSGGLGHGIAVTQSHAVWDRTVLTDNIIENNRVAGVHLEGDADMTVAGNLINGNGYGLHYDGDGAAMLVGNKILNNHSHGVLLDSGGRQVLVRMNQIWSNDAHGIAIIRSDGLIEDNDIDGNEGFEISTIGHTGAIPEIFNDVEVNKASPRRTFSYRRMRREAR